jgi:hypothetical protein
MEQMKLLRSQINFDQHEASNIEVPTLRVKSVMQQDQKIDTSNYFTKVFQKIVNTVDDLTADPLPSA